MLASHVVGLGLPLRVSEIPPFLPVSDNILEAFLSCCSGGEEDLDKDGGCCSVRIQCSEESVWITVQVLYKRAEGLVGPSL